jgi:predicted NAD-dependent protein-ADP-ribosyltransferase YbiA (DUF1768 family)
MPYGLLSNFADAPITLNNQQYITLNDYVYANVFNDIRPPIGAQNQFSTLVNMKNTSDEALYMNAIIHGTRSRFAQNKQLRDKLKSFDKSRPLVVQAEPNEARQLSMIFNQIRVGNFDAYGGLVPFDRVNAVVVGVAKQLLKNPRFQSAPFDELEQYAERNAPQRRDLVFALENLDEIVPVLKIKLRDRIYADELDRFKTHLLDVTLDHILATQYPNLTPDQYAVAKRQQLTKEHAVIDRYLDGLYRVYTDGMLPDDILARLQFEPYFPESDKVSVENLSSVAEESSEVTKFPMETLLSSGDSLLVVPAEFMPHYAERVRIDGVDYTSVVAYAYSKLFAALGGVDININMFNNNLPEIVKEYNRIKHDIIVARITDNNERATKAKLSTYPSILSLLHTTRGKKLIWMDNDDEVLGQTSNRMGVNLEYIRDTTPTIIPADITTMSSDIVFATWMLSRAEDYANTLKMFDDINANDFILIYGVVPDNRVDSVPSAYVDVLNRAGVQDTYQLIVIRFIVSEFYSMIRNNNRNANDMITHMVAFYNDSRPSQRTMESAEKILKQMYEMVKPRLHRNINPTRFAATILSGQQEYSNNQDKWWRINHWGNRKL